MEFMFVVIMALWFLGGFATFIMLEAIYDRPLKPTEIFSVFVFWVVIILGILIAGFIKSSRSKKPGDD